MSTAPLPQHNVPGPLVASAGKLLSVEDLHMHFPARSGWSWKWRRETVRAVNGVSFDLAPGETLALVGESGCGKSTLARAITRLTRPTSGKILLRGEDLAPLEGRALRQARRQVQMVFQDPFDSLNPRMRVRGILAEPLENYGLAQNLSTRLRELVAMVGLEEAALDLYPRQFSGGQRQRIALARALALSPALVVADEPLSSLDVSIQAQMVNLLAELQLSLGLSYLFISHDLGVVRLLAHRVAVMYLGQIVEIAPAAELFSRPRHPYTQALLDAVPVPDPARERSRPRRPLEGDVPSPARRPSGCSFHPRCPVARTVPEGRCSSEEPVLLPNPSGIEGRTACHLIHPAAGVRAGEPA